MNPTTTRRATSTSGTRVGAARIFEDRLPTARPMDELDDQPTAPDSFPNQLGLRLRAVRHQLAWTLDDVEKKSDGRWKAVTISAYERGDRAVAAVTLLELADTYGVPVTAFLPGHGLPCRDTAAPTIDVDLKRLATLPVGKAGALARYAAAIRSQSDDPGRDVLSMGPDGVRLMAAIQGATPMDLYCKLIEWGATPVGGDSVQPANASEWNEAAAA